MSEGHCPGELHERRREQRRAAAVGADRRRRALRQLGERLGDHDLQRMLRSEVGVGRPAVRDTGEQHGRMLAGAVHADWCPHAAGADVVGVHLGIERIGRRRLQGRLVQPSERQDLPHGIEVERLARMTSRGESPAAHHQAATPRGACRVPGSACWPTAERRPRPGRRSTTRPLRLHQRARQRRDADSRRIQI